MKILFLSTECSQEEDNNAHQHIIPSSLYSCTFCKSSAAMNKAEKVDPDFMCLCGDRDIYKAEIEQSYGKKMIPIMINNEIESSNQLFKVVEYDRDQPFSQVMDVEITPLERACIDAILISYGVLEAENYSIYGIFDDSDHISLNTVFNLRSDVKEIALKVLDAESVKDKIMVTMDAIYDYHDIQIENDLDYSIEMISRNELMKYHSGSDHPENMKSLLKKLTAIGIFTKEVGDEVNDYCLLTDESMIFDLRKLEDEDKDKKYPYIVLYPKK